MKLIICLFFATFATFPTFSQDKWTRVALFTTSIFLNSVGDGLYDEGKKLESKSFKAASIGTLVIVPLVTHVDRKKGLNYVLTFTCLRYTFFDAGYNLTRGLPFNYVGTTSYNDRFLGRIPSEIVLVTKGISLGAVIYLNKNK